MTLQSVRDLIDSVYDSQSYAAGPPPPDYFKERAILAARNSDVWALNQKILARLPGEEHTCWSADSYSMDCPTEQQNNDLPVEYLHSLNASGLPIAELRLKLGCPIILLRNIDPKRGLCNGTRATVLHISNRVLDVRLLTGDHAGETALIPRITLSPANNELDYKIKLNRRQFPVQLAFAMTINKSQGQTLDHIGLDLRKDVFSHGQLYVAFSRATSPAQVNVLLPANSPSARTSNVVYYEVLLT
jgi:ATP-dependent exoDNAse (exonuclease V) alpha subunit